MRMHPRRLFTVAAAALTACAAASAQAAGSLQWPVWGAGLDGKSYGAAETQISPANVGTLVPKWILETHGGISSTPTVDGDYLYVTDWFGYLYKVRRADGHKVWEKRLSSYTGNATSVSRNSPAITATSLILGDQASALVMAVDKQTGELKWKTSVETDGKGLVTSSPTVYNGVTYIGVASIEEGTIIFEGRKGPSFRGSVWALDLDTGKELWHRNTVPPGYTGGGVWASPIVVDPARGSIYVTTGDNVSVPSSVADCLNAIGTNQNFQDQAVLAQQLACVAPDNYVDAVVAYDMATGDVKWSQRMQGADVWNFFCLVNLKARCPFEGVDWDFGSGANLINTVIDGQPKQILGAGQKNGYYWAFDPDTGAKLWGTQGGPPSLFGGIHWGTATDDKRIYIEEANHDGVTFTLQDGTSWNGGVWSALDPSNGKILWQTKATEKALGGGTKTTVNDGALSVANGVLYAGTMGGDFVAMDAATGKILWTYASGGSVIGAPSIVDGEVYWGSGYGRKGTPNRQLYAFHLPTAAH